MRLRKRMANKNDVEIFYENKNKKQQEYRKEFYEDADKANENNSSSIGYLKITRDYGHK